MATFSSYENVGAKESIADVIANISPSKTPFLSSIGKEKISQKLHQWQEDSLAAVRVNAQVEGFTAADATLAPTVLRQNTTQILEKTIKVSGSLDATDSYGRAKETAYQLSKASAELKRDLEHALVGTKQTMVAGSSGVARQMAGAQAMIDATASKTKTGAAGTAMTEAHLLDNLQKCFNEGAEPTTILVTAADALNIADFAKAAGRYRTIDNDGKNAALFNVVDLYVSPFAEVAVVTDRFLAAGDSIVYDPSNWKLLTLRDWSKETLAKDGDSTKTMIVGEFSLKHVNFKASGLIRREA